MTEQPDFASAMTELAARSRKRVAQYRALERDIEDRWSKWVNAVGLEEAKRMFTEQTGHEFAGRPKRRDVLNDLVDDGVAYLKSKGVQKINQKRFAQLIQNAIKKQPLTDYVVVDDDDGDWDYEEVVVFRWDKDKDAIVRVQDGAVRTRVGDEDLRTRIRAGIARYEQAHSS